MLAPLGAIDTNYSVTPACSVYNFGTQSLLYYTVRMKVGSFYNQAATVNNHSAGTSQYVTFPAFAAWPRGTHVVACTTELPIDLDQSNDCQRGSINVSVHDGGVVGIVRPSGTVPPGVMRPQATLHNYGTLREAVSTTFTIPALSYVNTVTLPGGTPIGADTVVEFGPAGLLVGNYVARCSTWMASDIVSVNDTVSNSFTVAVIDVGVTRILAPRDSVPLDSTRIPQAVVKNFGDVTETFRVFFRIAPSYLESTLVSNLAAGDSAVATFGVWTATQVGWLATRCTTRLAGDQYPSNDWRGDSVKVYVFTGIEEPHSAQLLPRAFLLGPVAPCPFRDRTTVNFALPKTCHVALNIYDASGGLVTSLVSESKPAGYHHAVWNGRNANGRALGPGVYFCRLEAAEYSATRKLILTE